MKIQHIHGLPPLYTNTFLITTDAGHGILIDAAAAPEAYLDALKAENATSATKTLLGISGIGFAIRLFAFLC